MREFGVRSLKQVMTAWQQMQVPGVLGDDHHKHSRSGTLKKRHWSMAMSAEDGSDFEDLQSPLKCCRGFQWEEDTKSCTACLYPGYGRGCRLRCNCSETDCSRYIGCKIVSRTGLQEKGDRFAVLFGKPPPRTELSMSWFRSTVANVTCTQRVSAHI
ncbi:uncharacterized protein LOC111138437 isoform X1 [Crassostrea virginica]